MADYRLTAGTSVIRTADEASIPDDPANKDWQDYQQWLADGGVPDPYVPPPEPEPVPPPGEVADVVLYEHENRIRALEGRPPLTPNQFNDRLSART